MSDSSRNKGGDAAAEPAGPSTNREPVPGGLEGSIMEPERARESRQEVSRAPKKDSADHDDAMDRAEGNERRSDDN